MAIPAKPNKIFHNKKREIDGIVMIKRNYFSIKTEREYV